MDEISLDNTPSEINRHLFTESRTGYNIRENIERASNTAARPIPIYMKKTRLSHPEEEEGKQDWVTEDG